MTRPVIGLNAGIVMRTWKRKRRPKIEIYPTYTNAVEAAGGLPMVLPCTADPEVVEEQLERIDGLVLTGGNDYAPGLYGQKKHPKTKLVHRDRQKYDLMLARGALNRGIPVFGICGGHQLVNVVLGGDLIQHVEDGRVSPDFSSRRRNPLAPHIMHARSVPGTEEGVRHRSAAGRIMHYVSVVPGTWLARIVKTKRLSVNSSHHQAIGRLGDSLCVSARSKDGLIEAFETTAKNGFMLCVQWHPEAMPDKPKHLALFQALVKAAK